MSVATERDAWKLVFAVTVVSVIFSLLITYLVAPEGLTYYAMVPAVAVPLIVAPPTSYFVARMMLRIHRLNQRLEYLVRHDELTGLLNRNAFFERLEQLGEGVTGSIAICDIDRFKSINDTFGHLAGDATIRKIADTLRDMAGPDGLVARFGGEEFVFFFPNVALDLARSRAETICAEVNGNPVRIAGKEVRCTLSIGLSFLEGKQTSDGALALADKALYRAKNAGRNQVVLSGEGPETTVADAVRKGTAGS